MYLLKMAFKVTLKSLVSTRQGPFQHKLSNFMDTEQTYPKFLTY